MLVLLDAKSLLFPEMYPEHDVNVFPFSLQSIELSISFPLAR